MIKKKITERLAGKYVCVMSDCATKNKRSILGVNVQAIIDDEIVIFTICMEQITVRHTSENLCDIHVEVLARYEIEPHRVYGFNTDNAINYVKMGRLLDEESAEYEQSTEDEDWESPIILTESEYDDAILNMLNDCEFYADLISNVAEKYAQRNKDIHVKNTNTIGCASHTLHLAVEGGIRSTTGVSKLIAEVRAMIKKLRTPTVLTRIQGSGFKLPQIDVPTRWNSKYIMVSVYISIHFVAI